LIRVWIRLWIIERKLQSVCKVWSGVLKQRSVEHVDGTEFGAGGRSRLWNRWTEQSVEQVAGAECGAHGLNRLWNRWIEQTVEQVD
jgi:hypothetical protein